MLNGLENDLSPEPESLAFVDKLTNSGNFRLLPLVPGGWNSAPQYVEPWFHVKIKLL